ncbi:MAG: glutaredoxin domain-containing protein [Chloroflexota bacterium]
MSAELDLLRRDQLAVYGAGWCADCARVRRHLDAEGVGYEYVDLTSDPIAQSLLDSTGIRAIPVVVTPDGRMLIEPSTVELDALLAARPAA